MSSHHLAAGVVILVDDKVVLVREDGTWGLPKGTPVPGEALSETAWREALEETGAAITIGEVAFVSEYRSRQWGSYLQVYYEAGLARGAPHGLKSKDPSIEDVRPVAVAEVRQYMRFRPWLVPLEGWLAERRTRYDFFDLDRERATL